MPKTSMQKKVVKGNAKSSNPHKHKELVHEVEKPMCSKDLPRNSASNDDAKTVNSTQINSSTKSTKATGHTQKLSTSGKKASNTQQETKDHLEKQPLKSKVLKFTQSLTTLFNKGVKLQDYSDPLEYLHKYFLKHKLILRHLVYLVWQSEDLQICKSALHILCELLMDSEFLSKCKKSYINECLCYMDNFNLLTESLHTLHLRFSGCEEYKADIIEMRTTLVQLILALAAFEPCNRKLKLVSKHCVQFVVGLLIDDILQEQVNNLFNLLKLLCSKTLNCSVLANSKFYDILSLFYYQEATKNSVLSILASMTKNRVPLIQMIEHEGIIDLMLTELLSTDKESPLSKWHILTTLYESIQTECGFSIISKKMNFNKLHYCFCLDIPGDNNPCRLMLYTILNLCANRNILFDVPKNIDLFMTDKPMQIDNLHVISDNSLSDSDDSDEECLTNEDDECSHTLAEKASSLSIDRSPVTTEVTDTEPLTDMKAFFYEFKKTTIENLKFGLFAEANSLTDPMIFLEHKVGRIPIKDNLAYPDFVMLKAAADTEVINSAYNMFPHQHFNYKLQCACGLIKNIFAARIVYDIDNLKDFHSPDCLEFDSCFECGNLHRATQIGDYEYDLIVSPDTKESTTIQWFYFQIRNVSSDAVYHFNIINFTSSRNLYNKGMRPLMFSKTDYELNGTGWVRCGENVTHFGNHYTDKTCCKQYRSLLFSIKFQHCGDYIYFASHYPYTYSRLMAMLAPLINHKSNKIYVRLDKLCDTARGLNEVPLLTITAKLNASCSYKIPLEARPIVVITGRVHPGESNSSWIVEGIFNLLLNEENEHAAHAREHFIFKIVPMLNPEGVVAGNTRASLTGADLNRCWSNPDKVTCPEIYYTKRLVKYALAELKRPVATYIDIHGHRLKRGFFFYGCNPKQSWNKADRSKGNRNDFVKFLPETVATISKHICIPNCSYHICKAKEKSARVVMWREFNIENSYTLECNFSEAYKRKSIDTKVLYDIGESIIIALGRIAVYAYKLRKCMPTFGLDFKSAAKTTTDKKGNAKNKPPLKQNF